MHFIGYSGTCALYLYLYLIRWFLVASQVSDLITASVSLNQTVFEIVFVFMFGFVLKSVIVFVFVLVLYICI